MFLRLSATSPKELTALIGTYVKVTKTIAQIPGETGLVYVNGDEWPAYSENGQCIHEKATVCIRSICGIRLIVSE